MKKYLLVFLISMVPLIELRGAIPYAVGFDLPIVPSIIVAMVGKGGRKLEAKAGVGLYMALLLFVGIPLPGTGAWTGTLAASLLDLDFKKSVLYILFGLLLAAAIMLAISLGVFGAISLVK